jgi:hypothetical protein
LSEESYALPDTLFCTIYHAGSVESGNEPLLLILREILEDDIISYTDLVYALRGGPLAIVLHPRKATLLSCEENEKDSLRFLGLTCYEISMHQYYILGDVRSSCKHLQPLNHPSDSIRRSPSASRYRFLARTSEVNFPAQNFEYANDSYDKVTTKLT